jgi:RNA polymerase sigma-70 factor (ECF subfamily)
MMPEPSKHTAFDLFRKLGAGSGKALETIARLYKKELLSNIIPIVGNEELAKEVFSDMLQALWEHKKAVAKMDKPVGWMIVIARNKSINKIRDEKRKNTIPLEDDPGLESSIDIAAELEVRELRRYLQLAEEKLTPRQKLVYALSRKHGLNRKEIAKKCGLAENTVRNQLNSAIKSLRANLAKLMSPFFI